MGKYDYEYTVEGQAKKVEESLEQLERCYAADMACLKAARELYLAGDYRQARLALKRTQGNDRLVRGAREQCLDEGLGLLESYADGSSKPTG